MIDNKKHRVDKKYKTVKEDFDFIKFFLVYGFFIYLLRWEHTLKSRKIYIYFKIRFERCLEKMKHQPLAALLQKSVQQEPQQVTQKKAFPICLTAVCFNFQLFNKYEYALLEHFYV